MGISERREIELKNKDKTVQKMSRDGLVEENLAQGTRHNVSQREKDFDPARPAAEQEQRAESRASGGKHHRPANKGRDGPQDAQAPKGADAPGTPTEASAYSLQTYADMVQKGYEYKRV